MNEQANNEQTAKPTFRELVARINASTGPSIKDEEVPFNGEVNVFRFRKLSFIEADQMRSQLIGSDGRMDPSKLVGNNLRILAKTLLDENNQPLATEREIATWDKDFIDALAKAATKVNKLTESSKEELGKESAATAAGASS